MNQATTVNLKFEDCDVRIDRPSKWGNPFRIGIDGTRDEVIQKYLEWLLNQPELMDQLSELQGKRLGCWCSPDLCHGDVLCELVNDGVPNLSEDDFDNFFEE